MIRKAATKFLILAAVALVSGATTVNCSKKSGSDDVGSVGLALTLPGGGIINTVNYTITGNGITPITGTIDVSAAGTTTATALVSGLAPGMYSVSMTATSSDMQSCMGSAPFTVTAGQTAMANVVLLCSRTPPNGSVAINGRIDQCPFITSFSASTLQAPAGGVVNLAVAATDSDGDPITYTWTASPGSVGTLGANGPMTTFTCGTAGGTVQISIAVADAFCGDTRLNAIPITCLPGVTGMGGMGGAAGQAGQGGAAGQAGQGGAGRGGNGGGGNGGSPPPPCINTETTPPPALAASCGSCLMANFSPTTDGCCGITDATGNSLCFAVSACIRPTGCNMAGDTTTCFCGTNQATCDQAGAANGPCVAQITAAAGRNITTLVTDVPSAAQVLARFGDPNYAVGRVVNIEAVAGAFCPAECGF